MDFVGQLWLPILLSAVLCFIASALIWMVGPHHKKEWQGVPGEDALIDLLRKAGVGQGSYMFPKADRSDKTAFEAGKKKWAEGPSGIMFIVPKGQMGMGKMLAQQFAFFLLVGVLVALVDSRGLPFPATYMFVFKFTVVVALLAHFVGVIPESIWFGRPWKNVGLQLVDSLIYAGLTAGTFGWLWPK